MLKKILKNLAGIVFPPAKHLWELFDDISTWRDEKERERVQRFLEAYDDLVQFLEVLGSGSFGNGLPVSSGSGTVTVFPGLEDPFSAKVTAVVKAAADIKWDKQPLERDEVFSLYQKMKESFRLLGAQFPDTGD